MTITARQRKEEAVKATRWATAAAMMLAVYVVSGARRADAGRRTRSRHRPALPECRRIEWRYLDGPTGTPERLLGYTPQGDELYEPATWDDLPPAARLVPSTTRDGELLILTPDGNQWGVAPHHPQPPAQPK